MRHVHPPVRRALSPLTHAARRAAGLLAVLALAAGATTGCGEDAGPAPTGASTIGRDGGTVESPEGVSITVPPGSLSAPITLRVARDSTGLGEGLDGTPEAEKAVALSPTFSLTPHGALFDRSVEVRIPLDPAAAVGPGLLVALHAAPGAAGWDVTPIQAVEGGAAVVALDSFSYVRVVKVTQLLVGMPVGEPPRLEMTMTLGGASPTSYSWLPPLSAENLRQHGRRLYGSIGNRTGSLRLAGRVVGLPAACSSVALAGRAVPAVDPAAGDVWALATLGGSSSPPIFAETLATVGADTTGGVTRPTLSFAFDIGVENAPYKRELFELLRSRNVTGPTPTVGLSFNAFMRCTTPIDLGGGVTLQNWRVTPGLRQLPVGPDGAQYFEDDGWRWSTILFTTDYLPQGFETHPEDVTVLAGSAAQFGVRAWPVPVGENRIEWWRSDNAGLHWSRVRTTLVPLDAPTDTYTLSPATAADHDALFRARLCAVPRLEDESEGCTDGLAARLTVVQGATAPSFVEQPRSVLVRTGQTASLSVAVAGEPAPAVRWQTRPANSSAAWSDATAGSGAGTVSYTTAPLTVADNGLELRAVAGNLAGEVASVPVTVSVSDVDVAPTIVAQPAALSVVAGSEAVFAVVARGTEALSYEWRRDGQPLPGAGSPVLKLPAVTEADASAYSVRVSNGAGSVTSEAASLQVSAGVSAPVAPSIVTEPVSVLVNVGNTATFAVGASGTGPLAYQWTRDGQAVPGATAAFHAIAAAAEDDAGTYAVVVSNAAGSATSRDVVLTVHPALELAAPAITVQPADASVVEGSTAEFTVAATGSALRFQWTRGGLDVPGATSATYTTPALALADGGAVFEVLVYNAAGLVRSAPAVLTVTAPPAVTIPTLASVRADGGGAPNSRSGTPSISADGRLVGFMSDGTNLVPGTSVLGHGYVRDVAAGVTTLVNVRPDGGESSRGVTYLKLAAGGRHVVFSSLANDLVPDDTNVAEDVFLRDLEAGTTTRLNVLPDGSQDVVSGNAAGTQLHVSADGRLVLMGSGVNLTGDGALLPDGPMFFLRDTQAGTTRALAGLDGYHAAALSRSGRFVAVVTATGAGAYAMSHLLVHDVEANATVTALSVSGAIWPEGIYGPPSISDDGRYVSFGLRSTTLLGGAAGTHTQIVVLDRQGIPAPALSLESVTGAGAIADGHNGYGQLSADGRYLLFQTSAPNLAGDPAATIRNYLMLRDRQLHTTAVASRRLNGTSVWTPGGGGALSSDGAVVAYVSSMYDMTSAGFTDDFQVFVAPRP